MQINGLIDSVKYKNKLVLLMPANSDLYLPTHSKHA